MERDAATAKSQCWKAEREIMVETAASRNSNSSDPTAAKKVHRKRGRWIRRCLTLLLLIGMIGWFAPTIIAATELRNILPKLLLPSFPGTCSFGETSLGWFSPISIKSLRLNDDEGRSVLEVSQLTSTKPLWSLVLLQDDLGTFKIVQPVLSVSLTDHDSNVERILSRLIGDKKPRGSLYPQIVIEIESARIELEHVESKSQSTIEKISLRAGMKRDGLDEINLAIGDVPDSATHDSPIDWIAVRYGSTLNDKSSQSDALPGQQASTDQRSTSSAAIKQAIVKASRWKLDRLKPLLSRFLPNNELNGELVADATLNLSQTKADLDWDWNGLVSLQNLLVAPKDAILRDRLDIDQLSISGRAISTGGRLALHDFKVTTDVGELSATGECAPGAGLKNSSGELIQSLLSNEDYHVQGHVDLKKLAALLPHTLHVRDGIEITSGDVRAEFVGVDVQGVRRWSGTAEIAGLNALRQGQRISWDHPIASRINAHRDREVVVIDLLECKSDFLQVIAKGTLDDARFTANGDLSKLARNVEQFVDLGLDQLSGLMKASGEIKRSDAEHASLNSKMMLDDFAYIAPKGSAWREKHLDLSIVANGQMDARPMLTRVDTAEAHLKSGSDTFDFVLQQPIDLKSASPIYVANAQMSGALTSWQNRLRPFASLENWKLVGSLNLATNLSADANQVTVSQLKVDMRDLVAETPGWQVKDPEITFQTSGKWDNQAKRWTSPAVALHGKTLTVDLADLDCSFGQQGLSKLTGSAVYQADLVQLSSWRNLAIPNPSHYLIGSLSGSAKITQQDRLLSGEVDTQVEKLVVAGLGTGPNGQPQWVSLWKEPRLKLAGRGSYDQLSDLLTFDTGQFDIEGFSVGAQGKLSECSTNQRIELTGQLSYDWDTLTSRFGSQSGQQIQLSGKEQRPFSLKGALASLGGGDSQLASSQPAINGTSPSSTGRLSDVSGQAGMGWTRGNLYGVKVGAGDLKAQLDQGVCRFAPIDLEVNDGRLHATPTLYLDRSPYTVVLPQEKVVDHVSLSRELCNSWMKFVAPMLADSAQVEGKISLDLDQATIPMGSTSNAVGGGVMTIHGAQARPGPLAMQIVQSINQIRSIITRQAPSNPNSEQVWVEMPEQQVPIKMEQGRISHEGLTFLVANVTVKTSGSVGMDSTLDLVAQIPIKDDWLGNKKILKGTTSRPQIDPSFFRNLAQQFGGSLVDDLLQDKLGGGGGVDKIINNGLDKLLKGKK